MLLSHVSSSSQFRLLSTGGGTTCSHFTSCRFLTPGLKDSDDSNHAEPRYSSFWGSCFLLYVQLSLNDPFWPLSSKLENRFANSSWYWISSCFIIFRDSIFSQTITPTVLSLLSPFGKTSWASSTWQGLELKWSTFSPIFSKLLFPAGTVQFSFCSV